MNLVSNAIFRSTRACLAFASPLLPFRQVPTHFHTLEFLREDETYYQDSNALYISLCARCARTFVGPLDSIYRLATFLFFFSYGKETTWCTRSITPPRPGGTRRRIARIQCSVAFFSIFTCIQATTGASRRRRSITVLESSSFYGRTLVFCPTTPESPASRNHDRVSNENFLSCDDDSL